MWITILIIVMAMAMVVGPVVWLQPSDRDRRVASLRDRASVLGLKVQLIQPEQLKLDTRQIDEPVALYFFPWDLKNPNEKAIAALDHGNNWVLSRRRIDHELHFAGHWHWLSGKVPQLIGNADERLSPLKEFLKTTGDNILVLQCKPSGVAMGWLEKGGAVQVDDLKQKLEDFKAVCAECLLG